MLRGLRTRPSFLSEARPEAGSREPLTPHLRRQLMAHIAGLDEAEVASYTYEARPSDFPGARADLSIYGPDGRLRFRGRDFYGGVVAIWTP